MRKKGGEFAVPACKGRVAEAKRSHIMGHWIVTQHHHCTSFSLAFQSRKGVTCCASSMSSMISMVVGQIEILELPAEIVGQQRSGDCREAKMLDSGVGHASIVVRLNSRQTKVEVDSLPRYI
eukprot:1149467-Pelagomonas_calceolata.AAC.10